MVIECKVRGRPKVEWYKDDSGILNNRYRRREEPGGIQKLIITNPIQGDFGTFTCRAQDDENIDEIYLKIDYNDFKAQLDQNGSEKLYDEVSYRNLKKKPVFSTPLRDRSVADNSSIKLTCNVLGDEFDIQWMKNDQPISKSTRYRTILENGLASFEIFSTCPEDSGEYSCIARNAFGETVSRSILKVYKGFEALPKTPQFTRVIKGIFTHITSFLSYCCQCESIALLSLRYRIFVYCAKKDPFVKCSPC